MAVRPKSSLPKQRTSEFTWQATVNGRHAALHLAANYPELIETVFASGQHDFALFSNWTLSALLDLLHFYILLVGFGPMESLLGLVDSSHRTSCKMITLLYLVLMRVGKCVAAAGSGRWWDRNFDDSEQTMTAARKIQSDWCCPSLDFAETRVIC